MRKGATQAPPARGSASACHTRSAEVRDHQAARPGRSVGILRGERMNTRLTRRLAVVAAFTVSAGSVAGAQTGFNPSFQTPRVVGREFNVAVTDQYDTSLLFQWREGLAGGRSQFSLDLGYAD